MQAGKAAQTAAVLSGAQPSATALSAKISSSRCLSRPRQPRQLSSAANGFVWRSALRSVGRSSQHGLCSASSSLDKPAATSSGATMAGNFGSGRRRGARRYHSPVGRSADLVHRWSALQQSSTSRRHSGWVFPQRRQRPAASSFHTPRGRAPRPVRARPPPRRAAAALACRRLDHRRPALPAPQNMITGVTKGYEYKMRLVYAHFPININIESERRARPTRRRRPGAGPPSRAARPASAQRRSRDWRGQPVAWRALRRAHSCPSPGASAARHASACWPRPTQSTLPPPHPCARPCRQRHQGGDPQLPGREDCAGGGDAAGRQVRALVRRQG